MSFTGQALRPRRALLARACDALATLPTFGVVAPGGALPFPGALPAPRPVLDLRHIVAVSLDVFAVIDQLVADLLFGIGGPLAKLRHAIDDVADEMESVEVVDHAHIERRRGRALFLVAADMNVIVPRPPIGQAMDEPRIAVEGEDNWLVDCEERVEVTVGNAVRVLAPRLQRHHIDNVDDTDFQFGRVLAQELDGSQGFERRHVSATGHHDIRLAAAIVARPRPDPYA